MHHVDAAVDEAVREADLIGCHAVAPVATPVCRHDCQVTRLLRLAYPAAELIGSGVAERGYEMYPRSVISGRPRLRDAAGRRTEGEDQNSSPGLPDRNNRG